MSDNIEVRWSGPPAVLAAAMAEMGHPAYAAPDAPVDPRVLAFAPARLASVGGRDVLFTLLLASEEIPPPTGAHAESGPISEAAVGVFAAGAVPPSVTNAQGRMALARQGMLGAVRAYCAALGEDSDAYLMFEYAPSWRRYSPAIRAMAGYFGLTETQVDSLFILAATF